MPLNVTCIDMDGVLVDFHGECLRAFGLDPALRARWSDWDAGPGLISEHLGRTVTDADMWARVDEIGAAFWEHLPWLPWGRELFEICSAGPSVIMSSAASGLSAAGKIAWIDRELPRGWHKRYALTTGKHHLAHPGALLVDDGQHNVDAFLEHGGMAYLWPAPWNDRAPEYHADPTCRRALDELRGLLEGMR